MDVWRMDGDDEEAPLPEIVFRPELVLPVQFEEENVVDGRYRIGRGRKTASREQAEMDPRISKWKRKVTKGSEMEKWSRTGAGICVAGPIQGGKCGGRTISNWERKVWRKNALREHTEMDPTTSKWKRKVTRKARRWRNGCTGAEACVAGPIRGGKCGGWTILNWERQEDCVKGASGDEVGDIEMEEEGVEDGWVDVEHRDGPDNIAMVNGGMEDSFFQEEL